MVLAHSSFSSSDDGLSAVGDLEFVEDVGEVVAHCLGAEEKALRDLGVVLALGE